MQEQSNLFHVSTLPESRFIRHIWQINRTDCGIAKEKILPKGTAEIIFNFSNQTLFFRDSEKEATGFYKCGINGLNTSPFYLVKNHHQEFLGIQLHSFALAFLFNVPALEFTDRLINGFDVCASLKSLYDELSVTTAFESRVTLILAWVRKRLTLKIQSLDRSCIFDIYDSPAVENQSVQSMADYYNLSERHLRRLCREYIGLNAEDFVLYRKYVKALLCLHTPAHSLTQVAYDGGFYDQSHFIREFKSFTGLTPGQYRKQMSFLPGHLFLAS